MKHLYTLLTFLLLSQSVFGQFKKGDMFIDGFVGLSSQRSLDANGDLSQKSFSVDIGPSVGFFVSNSIAIGGRLSYGHSKSGVLDIYTSKQNSFGISSFCRKYFTLSDRFAFTLTGHLNSSVSKILIIATARMPTALA